MKQDRRWLEEWKANRDTYASASPRKRRAMERRALWFAAHTIHTPWRESYYRLATGIDPALPVATKFFASRVNLRPDDWPAFNPKSDAKSQFARALLGRDDAACFDVHMLTYYPKVRERVKRSGQWHGATQWQWAVWLHKLYPGIYPHARATVLREHCLILRWVRRGGRLPVNKQESLALVSEAGDNHRRGRYV
jgi:hypothetical protein